MTELRPPLSLIAPTRLAIDGAGNLWVADPGQLRVLGASPEGAIHTVIGRGHAGSGRGASSLSGAALVAPCGLAATADGQTLYIADPGAHAVLRASVPHDRIAPLAIAGPGPGDALAPRAVALDEVGAALYLAGDRGVIARVDLATLEARTLAQMSQPSSLALSPDRRRLYVAEARPPGVRVIDLIGGGISQIPGSIGADPARASHPGLGPDLALTPFGLAVVLPGSGELCGVNLRHGSAVTLWDRTGPSGLQKPSGLAFERTTRSYVVADTGNRRLLRISSDASRAAEICLRDPGS